MNKYSRIISGTAAIAALLAATPSQLSAAALTWNPPAGSVTGPVDGDGPWTSSNATFWNGTANVAAAAGDTLTFGVSTGGFTATINNGGAVLFSGTGNTVLNFNKSYTLAGNAAGDGISTGDININNNSVVTISAVFTSTAGAKSWNLNNGTLNLSGGGALQNINANLTSGGNTATLNISGGSWAGGTNLGGGGGNFILNATGGTFTGTVKIGGASASSVSTSATLNFNGASMTGGDVSIGGGTGAFVGNSVWNMISGTISGGNGELRIGNDGGQGVMNIQGGTITTTNKAVIGRRSGGTSAPQHNEMNISGGTTTVNQVQFDDIQTWASGSSGTLNVSGGTLYVDTAGITRNGSNANYSTAINLSGGTVGAKGAWSSSLNVTLTNANGGVTFKAADASNVAKNITLSGVISGGGGFTKIGGGVLTLSNASDSFGSINVAAGTLSISNNGTILDASDVFMTTGAVFNLNFAGTDTINALYFNGTAQALGTWGALGSGAVNQSAFFTGAGLINVTAVPEPGTWGLFGIGMIGLAILKRRCRA